MEGVIRLVNGEGGAGKWRDNWLGPLPMEYYVTASFNPFMWCRKMDRQQQLETESENMVNAVKCIQSGLSNHGLRWRLSGEIASADLDL